MTNKEIAKKLYEDENIVFGMIDKPNIIITNGTINYNNGLCNEYNKNAITIDAEDLQETNFLSRLSVNTLGGIIYRSCQLWFSGG